MTALTATQYDARILDLVERLRAAHAVLADLYSVTSPDDFPDLLRRAEAELKTCEATGWCDLRRSGSHERGSRDIPGLPDAPGSAAGAASGERPSE